MKKKNLSFPMSLIYFSLLFCGIICLVPILNTIAISFSDRTSAAMGLVKLWPVNFTLASLSEHAGGNPVLDLLRRIAGTGAHRRSPEYGAFHTYGLSSVKAPSQFRSKKSICGSWYLPCFSAAAWCPPLWSSISCT